MIAQSEVPLIKHGAGFGNRSKERLRDQSPFPEPQMSEPDEASSETSQEEVAESLNLLERKQAGLGLVGPALLLPILAAVVLIEVRTFEWMITIIGLTILASSILVAIDAHRLGDVDPTGRQWASTRVLFLAMCAVWVVVFPAAFFRRKHFSGPNLVVPAVIGTVLMIVVPPIGSQLIHPTLPDCSNPEVVKLVDQVIRNAPDGHNVVSTEGHHEFRSDADGTRRYGRCLVHKFDGEVERTFTVQWRDISRGQFEVTLVANELPSCTSQPVRNMLGNVLRKQRGSAPITSIGEYVEMNNDRQASRRYGQCVVTRGEEPTIVRYVVEWTDRDTGQFAVKVVP